MKPRRHMKCIYFLEGYCAYQGFIIDPCKPDACRISDFVCTLTYADPDFEPFIDELNRRLTRGV